MSGPRPSSSGGEELEAAKREAMEAHREVRPRAQRRIAELEEAVALAAQELEQERERGLVLRRELDERIAAQDALDAEHRKLEEGRIRLEGLGRVEDLWRLRQVVGQPSSGSVLALGSLGSGGMSSVSRRGRRSGHC